MKQKKTVLVLFGGVSSEHEISCLSAASVLSHMDIDKYEILKAGITKTGKWLLTESPEEMIRNGSWETDPGCREVLLSLDTEQKGFYAKTGDGWQHIGVDVVFPVLHGRNGEDGTVQGLLQMAGIPCVGSDTASSAACMDKGMAKAMISSRCVLSPLLPFPFIMLLLSSAFVSCAPARLQAAQARMSPPHFSPGTVMSFLLEF